MGKRSVPDKIGLALAMTVPGGLFLFGAIQLGAFDKEPAPTPESPPAATAPAGFSCDRLEVARRSGGLVTAVVSGEIPDSAVLVVDGIGQNPAASKLDRKSNPGEPRVDLGIVLGLERVEAEFQIEGATVPCPPKQMGPAG